MRRLILQFGFSLLGIVLMLPSAARASDVGVQVTVVKTFYIEVDKDALYFDINEWNFLNDYGAETSGIHDADGHLEDYESPVDYGWTETIGLDVSVWANANWKLMVKGTGGPTFSDGPWLKPVGDILWQDGIPSGWHHLSLTDTYINGDGVGVPDVPNTGHNHVYPTFRILLLWSADTPGVYHYNSVTFTAMAM